VHARIFRYVDTSTVALHAGTTHPSKQPKQIAFRRLHVNDKRIAASLARNKRGELEKMPENDDFVDCRSLGKGKLSVFPGWRERMQLDRRDQACRSDATQHLSTA
jgi:hypothetical protein